MPDFRVRLLGPEDFEAVALIHREGNEDVARAEPLLVATEGSAQRTQFIDQLGLELAAADHHHLGAERDGECFGWGHAYTVEESDGTRIGYVSAVYVVKEARRTGMGTALLEALVDWLDTQTVQRIQMLAVSRSQSRLLWLKRGFRPLTETLVLERPAR